MPRLVQFVLRRPLVVIIIWAALLAAVARAIANNPDLILADEPTASAESTQGYEVIRLLHQYTKVHQRCVIVANHDLRLAEYADRVIRMADGILTAS